MVYATLCHTFRLSSTHSFDFSVLLFYYYCCDRVNSMRCIFIHATLQRCMVCCATDKYNARIIVASFIFFGVCFARRVFILDCCCSQLLPRMNAIVSHSFTMALDMSDSFIARSFFFVCAYFTSLPRPAFVSVACLLLTLRRSKNCLLRFYLGIFQWSNVT